jgi:hypothetical protein
MRSSPRNEFSTWTTDPGIAARYAPIHGMVTELLTRVDPDGYTNLLENLRAERKPESIGEAHVIALLADLFWRIRGCFYLENEILKRGMRACGPRDAPDQALARTFMRETQGGGLLSKLSRYERRLSKEQSRCIRVLELFAKNRQRVDPNGPVNRAKSTRPLPSRDRQGVVSPRRLRTPAELAKLKTCTSVIQ